MKTKGSELPTFDIFISYSAKDKAVADAVVSTHEKVGIRCWYAPRDIPPGADWGDAIIQAIEQCSLMILIFSGNADQSQRVLDELNYSISEGKPILPFRVEDLEPTGAMRLHLSSRHWLDAYHPSWEAHIERLIESVSLNLGASYETVQISEAKPAVGEGKEKRFKIPSLPKAVYGVAGILILAGLVYFGWNSFGNEPPSAEPHTSPMPAGGEATPSQDAISFEDSKATAVAGTKAAIEVIETQDAHSTEQAMEKVTEIVMPSHVPTTAITPITSEWKTLSFAVPNDILWTKTADGRYSITGSEDTFAWSEEVIEGDFILKADVESDFGNYGEGMIVVYGDGISWTEGCLIFNITGYWQAIRAHTIYDPEVDWLARNEMLLDFEERNTYGMTIEVANDYANLYVDGDKVASTPLTGDINHRGRIALVKYKYSEDVTFSNVQLKNLSDQ
jgi:hypothetical protein